MYVCRYLWMQLFISFLFCTCRYILLKQLINTYKIRLKQTYTKIMSTYVIWFIILLCSRLSWYLKEHYFNGCVNYVRSTARQALHLQVDISAYALEIKDVKSLKCIHRCGADCTFRKMIVNRSMRHKKPQLCIGLKPYKFTRLVMGVTRGICE
jgi:hypothetical protein